jgi:hypothetical protein
MNNFLFSVLIFISGIKIALSQMVSSDTALLMNLVTTTASQLNELEKLVSNAEKYTEKVQQYNELFQDEYFKAERVLYIAESLAAKKDVQDLGDLNWAIRELKYSMSEMRELMQQYSMIKGKEAEIKNQVVGQKKVNAIKDKIAKSQVNKSINAKTSGRANQLTAQNTAMIYEQNVDMHNTQLEILENVSTTNRLLAEQMEEERFKQMEKQKTYGAKQK